MHLERVVVSIRTNAEQVLPSLAKEREDDTKTKRRSSTEQLSQLDELEVQVVSIQGLIAELQYYNEGVDAHVKVEEQKLKVAMADIAKLKEELRWHEGQSRVPRDP